MKSYESRKPSYFATPAVSLVIALHVSLSQIVKEGVENRFKQHKSTSHSFKDTIESWGLKLVPVRREVAANSMTAVYYPDGVTAQDLLPKIVQKDIVVAGGLHKDIASKYFRVGHMGISAVEPQRGHIKKVVEVLRASLIETGFSIK
jgi:alanine-glyoxylate transaminase / serine-glyoxylate transaminase / serine-pyruvate transaminase